LNVRGGLFRDGQHDLEALLTGLAHELILGHRLPPVVSDGLRLSSETNVVLALLEHLTFWGTSLPGDESSHLGQKYSQGLHEFSHFPNLPLHRPTSQERRRGGTPTRAHPPAISMVNEGIMVLCVHHGSPRNRFTRPQSQLPPWERRREPAGVPRSTCRMSSL